MPFRPFATTAWSSRIFFCWSVSSASIGIQCQDVERDVVDDGMRRCLQVDSYAVGNAYSIGVSSGRVKERLVKVGAMPASRTRRSTALVPKGFVAIAGHQRAITILEAH